MTDTDRQHVADRDALALAFAEYLVAHQGGNTSTGVDALAVRLAHVAIRAGWAPQREPRVWLPGDTVPAGVAVIDEPGCWDGGVWVARLT